MIKTTPKELQGIRVSYRFPTPELEFPDLLPEGLAIVFVEAQALGFGSTLNSSAKSAYPSLLPQVVNECILTSVLKHTDQSYLPLVRTSMLVSTLSSKVAAYEADCNSLIPQPLMETPLLVSTL